MIPGTALVAMSAAAVFAVVSCNTPPPPRDPGATAARPLTEREQELLHDAEERLTVSCMAAQDFRRWAVPRRPLPGDRDFPYGIDGVQRAARHGYGAVLGHIAQGGQGLLPQGFSGTPPTQWATSVSR